MHPVLQGTLSRLEAKIDGLYSLGLSDLRIQTGARTVSVDPIRYAPAKALPPSASRTSLSSALMNSVEANTSQNYMHHARPPILGDFELAIPFRHSTAPQNILSWPYLQTLSIQEDVRYPVRVELAHSQATQTSIYHTSYSTYHNINENSWLDELSLLDIRSLTRYYFENSHSHTPVLMKASFQEHTLASVLNKGWEANLNTCIVLLVFALGSLSAADSGDDRWLQQETTMDNQLGRGYFGPSKFFDVAFQILERNHEVSWASCQARLLVGYDSRKVL